MTNKDKIISLFNKISKLGFVKSHRRNNTGIGKTFEDYIGVVENNYNKPDLLGYEIKSHREASSSYVTLFTKTPSFIKGANSFLKENFGTPYDDNPALKHLHTSLFATKANNYMGEYSFKLQNDKKAKKILIVIYNAKTKKIIDKSCGYTYEDISKVLSKKLKKLFYVNALTKNDKKGNEFFHFNKAYIYEHPTLDRFLKLLDNGKIMYDIRIGSYKSGTNIGKTHDHGSGFRILEKDLHLLYSNPEEIE